MGKNKNKERDRAKFTALYIDPVCMKKINYYTQAADGEVSGLGTLIRDDLGRFVVNQVFLLDQECTGTETDLDPEAISKLMVDMIGRNEDPGQLKFWWHSHVNMGVFWSGTDDTACETLSREFAFSLVVNKKRESLCRLDLYSPFRVTIDGVRVQELPTLEDSGLKEACEKEVKDKVKAPVWKAPVYPRSQAEYDSFVPGGYSDYGEYGHHRGNAENYHFPHRGHGYTPKHSFFKKDEKIKLSTQVLGDIERLTDCADRCSADGGIFCSTAWSEYIYHTLKDVVEGRLAPKAGCQSPCTYSKTYQMCTNGKCRVQKTCEYWTRVFEESEEDAKKELVAMETSQEATTINETTVVTV